MVNLTLNEIHYLKAHNYTTSEIRTINQLMGRMSFMQARAYVKAQRNSVPQHTGKNGTFTSIA